MNPYVLFVLSVLFAIGLQAAVLPDSWGVDINQHTAVQRTYKQGETWEMRISLRDGLKPLNLTGATAKFCWYSNATDNVWWTNTATIASPALGLVAVPWTPAMDVGAPAYTYWLGIWPAGSTSPLWRATGTIRMLTSPGFIPNTLPPPVRLLDFATLTVTNAPWLTASGWISGSNAFATALQNVADAAAGAASLAESNRQEIAALPPPPTSVLRLVSTNSVDWIDGDGFRWHVTYAVTTNADQLLIYDSTMSAYGVRVMNRVGGSDQWTVGEHDYDLINAGDIYAESGFIVQGWEPGLEFMWTLLADPYDLTSFPKTYAHASNGHTGWVDRVVSYQAVTSRWAEVANKADIPTYPTNYVAGFRLPIPGTNAVYTLSVDSNRVLTVWEVLP